MPLREVMFLSCVALLPWRLRGIMNPRVRGWAMALIAVLGGCGGSEASISINITSLEVQASPLGTQPQRTIAATIRNLPSAGVYLEEEWFGEGLTFVEAEYVSDTRAQLNFIFDQPRPEMAGHTYQAVAHFHFCHDSSCSRPVKGSPLQVQTTYTVTDAAVPEPGLTALTFLDRIELAHDVVDAGFSAALNAVVVVAATPSPAVHTYDMVLGTKSEFALARVPTSVSVSPDGLHAAVGHDGLITHVDLATLGGPGGPAYALLDVSTRTHTVLLDGGGRVYAVSSSSGDLHTAEVATNTEQITPASVLSRQAHARLHPGGFHIYFATRPGLVPDDIGRYDVPLSAWWTLPHRPPHHGEYNICHNLWLNEAGTRIYTACGHTFFASSDPQLDMTHNGQLPLSESRFTEGYRILSLTQSEAMNEIVLIEGDWHLCEVQANTGACYTHLNTYTSDFLNPTGVYSIAAVRVDGVERAQRGIFVFHSGNGAHIYMISRLHGMQSPQRYYLTTIR